MKESTAVILELEKEGIDFIEISGGTYECAEMMKTAATRESTRKREAFFLEFAEKITQQTSVPLMVTGGFRTLAAMEQAVASGAVDIIGQARPYCAEPDLPKMFLAGTATKNLEYDLSFGPSFARSVRHLTTLLTHCYWTLTVTGDRPNAPKLLPSAADWNDGLWTGACAVLRQQAVVCDGSAVPDVCVGLGGKASQEQCHFDGHTFGPSLQDALVHLKRSFG